MYRLNDGKTVQFIYLWSEYYTCCKRTSRNRRILTPRDVFKRNEFLVPKRLSRNAEKYWIKWEFNFEYRKKKKVNFPLDQTTMYGDAMCEPFKMIEELNGWKPIRTLKKTVDFALWRKKRLFCSRSDKNVMCDINNKMGENLKQNQTFSIRTLKKTLDFALWRKKIILLLLIRQQCLEMLYVTRKIKWENPQTKPNFFDTYFKKDCWFYALKKKMIILLPIRQRARGLDMQCLTHAKWLN